MNPERFRSVPAARMIQRWIALLCTALLVPGNIEMFAQQAGGPPAAAGTAAETSKITSEQLESLVSPIALYPDPLLAQTLAASTYPLEIIQLQQWMGKHKELKDKALADAVQKQKWDPSVQGMVAFPDVIKILAENIKWTSELGNAFLAQQGDVMDAVQRMRAKAKDTGNLKSGEQVKVETQVIESKSVIVIQPAKPDVVYVPSYDPVVVYGAPPAYYPYPPVYPAGYYAAGMALSFGVGMALGAAWGGGWGYGAGWGGGNNNININRNNVYNNNSRANIGNSVGSGNGNWKHNPQHRGGAPYGDRATAKQYGGSARGDSLSSRQGSARQNQGQFGGRQQPGQLGNRQSGVSDRSAGGDRGGGRQSGVSNRSAGGDRVGNRQTSGSGSRSSGAFGGGGGGSSGGSARSSSSRGSSSFGGSRGGGGGSRGGGSRGGGGRRR